MMQETLMGSDGERGVPDLDIFEGLGKKAPAEPTPPPAKEPTDDVDPSTVAVARPPSVPPVAVDSTPSLEGMIALGELLPGTPSAPAVTVERPYSPLLLESVPPPAPSTIDESALPPPGRDALPLLSMEAAPETVDAQQIPPPPPSDMQTTNALPAVQPKAVSIEGTLDAPTWEEEQQATLVFDRAMKRGVAPIAPQPQQTERRPSVIPPPGESAQHLAVVADADPERANLDAIMSSPPPPVAVTAETETFTVPKLPDVAPLMSPQAPIAAENLAPQASSNAVMAAPSDPEPPTVEARSLLSGPVTQEDDRELSGAFGRLGMPQVAPTVTGARVPPPPPPGARVSPSSASVATVPQPSVETQRAPEPVAHHAPPAHPVTQPSVAHPAPAPFPAHHAPPPPSPSVHVSSSSRMPVAPSHQPPPVAYGPPPAAYGPPPAVHAAPPVYARPPMPLGPSLAETHTIRKVDSTRSQTIAVFAIIVALVAGGTFFLMPRSGALTVNVADAKGAPVQKLVVEVNGVKKCEASPCVLHEVDPGKHKVKITAPGFETVPVREVDVDQKQIVTTDFVLTPSKPPAGQGFKVTGNYVGLKVSVDGRDLGQLNTETDLDVGPHKIHFSGDRYEPMDKSIVVDPGKLVDFGALGVKVTKGKATITNETPGAKVFLVDGTTKKEVPQSPMAIEFGPNEKWELLATKPGYSDFKEPISFADGNAEKTFSITLTPKNAK